MSRHRYVRRAAAWFAVLTAIGIVLPWGTASGLTYTWDGGGVDNNITTAQNWVGDIVPGANADIIWAGSVRLGVMIDAGGAGRSFTFGNTAGAFTLSGAATSLSSGIVNNSTSLQTLNLPLSLTAAQSYNAAAGNLAFGGTTLANGGFLLTISGGFNTAISNVISGNGGLTKTGAGVLTVSGANTYSGLSTINGGTVVISSAAGLGSNASATINAGTLEVAGTFSTGRTFTLGNTASTFLIDPTRTYTATGVISGSGALNKTGAGTMVLGGNNTYSGGTNVSAGTLQINGSGRIGNTTALTVSGGTFSLQAFNETVASVILTGGSITGSGTLTGSSYSLQSGTVSANLGGSAALTKSTAGSVTLSGANSYTGGTAINGGTLALASSGAVGASGTISFAGGTLQYSASNTTDYSSRFSNGLNQAYSIDTNGQNITFANGLTSLGGSLTKLGSGTLTLNGLNLFTGGTVVTGGTLLLGAADRLLNAGALTVSGGTFGLQTFAQTATAVTLTSGSITGPGILTGTSFDLQSGSVSAVLAGVAAVTKSTSGAVTLSGLNLYTGSTAVNAGTLQVDTNGALGTTLAGTTVASGAALKLNGVNYLTAEALTLNGSGIANGGALVNTGTSTYAGAINAATNATINAGGGVLTLTGGVAKNGTTLTLSGGGTINISNNGITGSSPNSDLVVDGTTVVLNAANSYNGPTTVQNSGVLQLGANNVLPSSPQTAMTVNTSSALNMAGYNDGVASLAGDSTATVKNSVVGTTSTLTVNPATGVSTTFAGNIAGTNGGAQGNMALIKTGAGALTLTGANTYTGSTTVSGGTLTVANTSGVALDKTSSIVVNNGGTLLLGASNQLNNTAPITLAGGTFGKGNFSEGSNVTTNTPGLGALTLTATGSHLDFSLGTVGAMTFASFTPGAFTLTIDNWSGTGNTIGNGTTDRLLFNSDQAANLNSFSFTGYTGATQFDLGNGYFEVTPVSAVPEPSTYAAGLLALLALGFHHRRQLRGLLRRRKGSPKTE